MMASSVVQMARLPWQTTAPADAIPPCFELIIVKRSPEYLTLSMCACVWFEFCLRIMIGWFPVWPHSKPSIPEATIRAECTWVLIGFNPSGLCSFFWLIDSSIFLQFTKRKIDWIAMQATLNRSEMIRDGIAWCSLPHYSDRRLVLTDATANARKRLPG
jgi:hypothetical protein